MGRASRRKKGSLPPGITPGMVAQHERRQAGLEAARGKALPGPLRAAFAGEPLVVRGRTFVPVTAGLLAILERIGSPLPAMVRLKARFPDKKVEDLAHIIERELKPEPEALIETVWVMTNPLAATRTALAKGRTAFREMVMTTFGDILPAAHLGELQVAAAQWFIASFATAVEYEAEKEPDAGFPSPPAQNRTA